KIVKYPITNFNGITKLSVPTGSAVLNVIALENTHEIVHVLVTEPVAQTKEEAELTNIVLLTVNDEMPFSEPDEDSFLSYVGSVAWDNGHRLHHAFLIEKEEAFDVTVAPYVEDVEEDFVPDTNISDEVPTLPELSEEAFNSIEVTEEPTTTKPEN
ncbi:MAG: hypothetical protein ACW987_19195, partial [Candidatus Thorarchaeota archaeon]